MSQKRTINKGNRSELVKAITEKSGVTREELAIYLGTTKGYVDRKFYTNSFSLDDVVIIAYACNMKIGFLGNDATFINYVDPEDYFRGYPKILKRLMDVDKIKKERIREEYERLKAELESVKEQYDFED